MGGAVSELDQQLADMLADGRITSVDADEVLTFRQFLRESGPPPTRTEDGKRRYPPDHPLHDPAARARYLRRWGPYMHGEADGPIELESEPS